jgi:hypothetical protein
VQAFVERFVAGDRKATLITPKGYGIEPPFKRLRRPHQVVVEMRTNATRSFGFFASRDTYVAMFLVEVSPLKTRTRGTETTGDREDPYRVVAAKVEKLLCRLSSSEIDRTTNVEDLVSDL